MLDNVGYKYIILYLYTLFYSLYATGEEFLLELTQFLVYLASFSYFSIHLLVFLAHSLQTADTKLVICTFLNLFHHVMMSFVLITSLA